MDMWDGIFVGAAAAAIGSIIAYQVINRKPVGGGAPMQPNVGPTQQYGRIAPVMVIMEPGPAAAAPLQQTTPNQEAAFNVQPVTFEIAFGNTAAQAADPTVLPY